MASFDGLAAVTLIYYPNHFLFRALVKLSTFYDQTFIFQNCGHVEFTQKCQGTQILNMDIPIMQICSHKILIKMFQQICKICRNTQKRRFSIKCRFCVTSFPSHLDPQVGHVGQNDSVFLTMTQNGLPTQKVRISEVKTIKNGILMVPNDGQKSAVLDSIVPRIQEKWRFKLKRNISTLFRFRNN